MKTKDEAAKERAAIDERRERAAAQIEADTKWLMSSEQGRRLMWGWLSQLGLYRTPYASDAGTMSFNVGTHNAALMLWAQVFEHCPDACATMAAEARR